jgi:hypothetical protein
VNVFRFVPGYETQIVVAGKEPLILLLLAFLVTFALTRLYTRLARIYGWGSGSVHGVHLHHMVVGIVIVLVAGVIAFAVVPGTPGLELLAIAFGSGAALILDEFALGFYLRDVYWSEEGRTSIDAAIMGFVLAGLLLTGVSPLGVEQEEQDLTRAAAAVGVAVNGALALATFLKGRLLLGLVSIFVPVVGLAALRLAKPNSPWARRLYRRSPRKLARSRARFEQHDGGLSAAKHRLYDLLGGKPSPAAEEPAETEKGGLPGV